jgi:hypothetical protein
MKIFGLQINAEEDGNIFFIADDVRYSICGFSTADRTAEIICRWLEKHQGVINSVVRRRMVLALSHIIRGLRGQ